ncbi:hypothetical protein CIK05_03165 [Bdellovibrio sp. qaytius]|nr:hypothetical protein CIK05_03165 [Bdellovibrio sp. qaytius]
MLAFKPKEAPILTQIANSGLFQFIMVVVLGVGVTWFVIRTDRPQQWIQRINRFASVTPNPKTAAVKNTEAGIAEDRAELEAPPAAASSWAARAMVASSPETLSAAATAVSATPSTQTTESSSSAQTATTAVRMLEVDNDYLSTIVQLAHNTNSVLQDGEVKIFILPSTTTVTSVQNLNSTNLTVKVNDNTKANYGTASRGFNLNLFLHSANADVSYFSLQLNKVHPNDSLQIPVEFALRKGEKLVIAGNPILSYFEFENDLINTPPFQIIKSADYKNQKTTFAIVIELQ